MALSDERLQRQNGGLSESNGSLPTGMTYSQSSVGWLPVHRDQLRAQRSVTNMRELYFTFTTTTTTANTTTRPTGAITMTEM